MEGSVNKRAQNVDCGPPVMVFRCCVFVEQAEKYRISPFFN